MDAFKDLFEKALAKKEAVDRDPNATESDKRLSSHIIEFLQTRDGFDHVSASTVFTIFAFVGYEVDIKRYNEMYDAIIEEVHRTYRYVDPKWFGQKEDK